MTQGRITQTDPGQTQPVERSRTGLAIEQGIALAWVLEGAGERYPAELRDPLAAVILRTHIGPRLTELLDHLDGLLHRIDVLYVDASLDSCRERTPAQRRAAADIAATQEEVDSAVAALHDLPDVPQPGDKVLINGGDRMALPEVWMPAVVTAVDEAGVEVYARSRHGQHTRLAGGHTVTDVAVYVPVTPAAVDGE